MSTDATRQPERRYPEFEPLAETLARVLDNITRRNGQPDFPTGFGLIDQTFAMQRQALVTIAARPSNGKSSLAAQLAYGMARRGAQVAYVSLEMAKESVFERLFCALTHTHGFELIMGQRDPQFIPRFQAFIAHLRELSLRIIDDYCFTERELFTLIEHLSYRPDVVIVDHIQHIRSTERRSLYETLTDYLRYLKELSRRYNFCVMALSQVNRQGDERPTLATLKGTGGIEEMSDTVCLLYGDHEWQLDTAGTNCTLEVAKHRNGPIGTLRCYFRPETYRFFTTVAEAKTCQPDVSASRS